MGTLMLMQLRPRIFLEDNQILGDKQNRMMKTRILKTSRTTRLSILNLSISLRNCNFLLSPMLCPTAIGLSIGLFQYIHFEEYSKDIGT